jgi:hypothetical protein
MSKYLSSYHTSLGVKILSLPYVNSYLAFCVGSQVNHVSSSKASRQIPTNAINLPHAQTSVATKTHFNVKEE